TTRPGNGDGTFQTPLTAALPANSLPDAIVAGDFNRDGRTDLAVADTSTNEVSILLGNGDGTFRALPPIPVAGGPDSIVEGDFTGNGQIDLAVASGAANTVTLLMGNGDGTFTALPPVDLPAFSDPVAIVAG